MTFFDIKNNYLFIIIIKIKIINLFMKFNEIFNKDKKTMAIEVMPVIIVLIIMAIIAKEVLIKYMKSDYLIIYQLFSALFTIYFSFLLSKYIAPKYIIISLSLVLIELVEMELYVLTSKNYKILFLVLR